MVAKRNLQASLLAASTVLCQSTMVLSQEQAEGGFRLSGGVSHSDRLEPLSSDERVGAPMSTTVGPAPSANMAPRLQTIPAQPSRPSQAARIQMLPQPPARQPASSRNQQPQRQYNLSAQQNPNRPNAAAILNQKQYQLPMPPAQPQGQANLTTLNAHINTQGSPMAPRMQVPTLDHARGARSYAAGATQYERNLQAMAAIEDQRTRQGMALQARVQSSVPKAPTSVKIEVPFWLAGEWLRSETNETSRIQLPGGKPLKAVGKQKAVADDVFGTIKDKDGRVWMIVPLHNRGSVDRGFAVDRHTVHKYELILTGKTSALVKVQAAHSVVDKRTNKVVQSYQDEELNAYSLVQDGLVRTDSSVKVFDQDGNPKLLTRATSMEKRVRKL